MLPVKHSPCRLMQGLCCNIPPRCVASSLLNISSICTIVALKLIVIHVSYKESLIPNGLFTTYESIEQSWIAVLWPCLTHPIWLMLCLPHST